MQCSTGDDSGCLSAYPRSVLLLVENRDSFSYNLVQLFQELGEEVLVRRSDGLAPSEVRQIAPTRMVVGPGPGTPDAAGRSLELVRSLGGELPILGVCLGLQAIGQVHGAELVRSQDLAHGQTRTVEHDGRGLFADLPSPLIATRYNSLALDADSLPAELEACAWTAAGELMGLRHRTRATHGVQFHPEAIRSQAGAALLSNFLAL